jgi:hypothetical protein
MPATSTNADSCQFRRHQTTIHHWCIGATHSLVPRSKLVPYSNTYLQRYYFMLVSRMTLALHPLPQTAIPEIPLRAPLSSLALFHKSENQLSCFQSRAHDFGEMGGMTETKAKVQREATRLAKLTASNGAPYTAHRVWAVLAAHVNNGLWAVLAAPVDKEPPCQ